MDGKTVPWEIDRGMYDKIMNLVAAVSTTYPEDSRQFRDAQSVRSVLDTVVDHMNAFK